MLHCAALSCCAPGCIFKGTLVTLHVHVCVSARLNNVLIRKVGNSMVLEAQKKAVKRQALLVPYHVSSDG